MPTEEQSSFSALHPHLEALEAAVQHQQVIMFEAEEILQANLDMQEIKRLASNILKRAAGCGALLYKLQEEHRNLAVHSEEDPLKMKDLTVA